jgi:hypothetical protein
MLSARIITIKHQTANTKFSQGGQFLLELIIAIAVLLMLMHAFFTLVSSSYQILIQSRSQVTAKAIANEKMEIIRNLPYVEIGTFGGIPGGSLLQTETVIRNGQFYTVTTAVTYKDDPFDQLAPTDLLPIDYKVVRVQVTWNTGFPNQHKITLLSNIAPNGVETTEGGGTLSLLVFDSQGQPVPQANVHVEAPTADPPVDLNLFTDDLGNLVLPGAPACTACYNLTVSKENFSTDRTYTTSEVDNPSKPPLTILEGQVTEASFAIDSLSEVTFKSLSSRETNYQTLGNVDFHLTGGKVIGTNTADKPVYKLNQDYTTDGAGNLVIQLEWDVYQLILNTGGYLLAGSNPVEPVQVTAGTGLTVKFVTAEPTDHSLLVKVLDAATTAVASASARLTGPAYDGSIVTTTMDLADWGHVFFSPLTAVTYTLEVSHNDYQTATASVSVAGETEEIIILNPR